MMKATMILMMAAMLQVACMCHGDKRIVEPKGGDAHMVLMEREYDCGQVTDEDGIVEHEFVVANDGGKAFVLLSARPQCDCTTVDFKPELVEPGYGTTVKVKLDVREISKGDFYREVHLTPSCIAEHSTTVSMRGVKL